MIGTPAYDEAIKDASALLWVNENTVPTVMAYGKYDKVQPYLASVRLDKALTATGVKHEYIVCEHSGHGLQNDNKQCGLYMEKVEEYLRTYLCTNKVCRIQKQTLLEVRQSGRKNRNEIHGTRPACSGTPGTGCRR